MDVMTENCLQGLLKPTTPEEFFADYFGKQILICRSSSESRFQHLLSLPQYQAIVGGLRHTDRTFQHRPSLAHRLNLAGTDGYLKMDGVLSGYAQGSSVCLDDVERRHLALQTLCDRLKEAFNFYERPLAKAGPCGVSLAPPECRAWAPHTNPTDLFVLQLDGEQLWQFYGDSPCSAEPGAPLGELPPFTREVLLAPGSLIYIPRGVAHSARTTGKYSFALTVCFTPYSWRQVISELLTQHLTLNLEMNRALAPPTIAGSMLSEQGLSELCETLQALGESDEFLMRARELRLTEEKTKLQSFEDVHRLQSIAADTVLRPLGELTYKVSEDRAYLMRADRYLQGPTRPIGNVFKSLAAREGPLQVRDVIINGDLATNIELARRLVFEGLYQIDPQTYARAPESAHAGENQWTA
jgi:ribosomal protein L16 Arg81 hydroxylase